MGGVFFLMIFCATSTGRRRHFHHCALLWEGLQSTSSKSKRLPTVPLTSVQRDPHSLHDMERQEIGAPVHLSGTARRYLLADDVKLVAMDEHLETLDCACISFCNERTGACPLKYLYMHACELVLRVLYNHRICIGF